MRKLLELRSDDQALRVHSKQAAFFPRFMHFAPVSGDGSASDKLLVSVGAQASSRNIAYSKCLN
jgi:hypothetical protein